MAAPVKTSDSGYRSRSNGWRDHHAWRNQFNRLVDASFGIERLVLIKERLLRQLQAVYDLHRMRPSVAMTIDTICWRRVDTAGHDACRLEQLEDGWRLDGAAVFRLDHQPVRLAYRLTCDAWWRTREGTVSGWIGKRDCELRITRSAEGCWTLNHNTIRDLERCIDLDFGFTPATNLSQLRRIALEVGEVSAQPVAWLDVTAGTLAPLYQRYERRTTHGYWYEAPQFNYAAQLTVRSSGFVSDYPGLWEEDR